MEVNKRGKLEILYYNDYLTLNHIAEALVISGLPMRTDTINPFPEITKMINWLVDYTKQPEILKDSTNEYALQAQKHFNRGMNLGKAKQGSGHDSYLKGIVVNAIISAPSYWYPQMQRYHFLDIISSQSKMHRITKMNLKEQCSPEVDEKILDLLNDLVEQYNNAQTKEEAHKLFRKIIANCPMGLNLTCGITTNYLQLKSMYNQRQHHKLEEWSKDFTTWVEQLPCFKELCLTGRDI